MSAQTQDRFAEQWTTQPLPTAISAPPFRFKMSGWVGPGVVALSYEGLSWFTGASVMSGGLPDSRVLLVRADGALPLDNPAGSLENRHAVTGLDAQKSSARTMILWDGGSRWWIGLSGCRFPARLSEDAPRPRA